jgi:hypothetical protein
METSENRKFARKRACGGGISNILIYAVRGWALGTAWAREGCDYPTGNKSLNVASPTILDSNCCFVVYRLHQILARKTQRFVFSLR